MIYLKKFSLFAEIKVSVWFQVLRLKDTRFVLVSVLLKHFYHKVNKLYCISIENKCMKNITRCFYKNFIQHLFLFSSMHFFVHFN